jgi:hypothetical protein
MFVYGGTRDFKGVKGYVDAVGWDWLMHLNENPWE